jgi:hypothetical protein
MNEPLTYALVCVVILGLYGGVVVIIEKLRGSRRRVFNPDDPTDRPKEPPPPSGPLDGGGSPA